MSRLPLEGVRIAEMTVVMSAPYGTMILADMGAEVIRLESTQVFPPTTRGNMARPDRDVLPSLGVMGRAYPDLDPGERPWNRTAHYTSVAHNKRSMTVDLNQPEGPDIARDLIRVSDLFIENQPGVADKFGLDYQSLRKVNPSVIMVSISGMGATGPYRKLRGFGSQFEDILGHAWLRGYPEDHPSSNTACVAADPAAGAALVWLTLAALHHRDRTGQGQWMDMSMAENYIHHLGSAFLDYSMNGREQRTLGNRHPFMAPHGCYPCEGDDAWVTIGVGSDEQWRALRTAMGDPEWARERRFADGFRRHRNQEELDERIAEWTRLRNPMEAQEALQTAGVPAGAVMNSAEIMRDRHLRERGFFHTIAHPEAGTHDYPFGFWRMSETPFELRQTAPLLGEHNEYVYKDLLGTTEERYRQWEKQGHIGMDYAPHIR